MFKIIIVVFVDIGVIVVVWDGVVDVGGGVEIAEAVAIETTNN